MTTKQKWAIGLVGALLVAITMTNHLMLHSITFKLDQMKK